MNVYKAESDNLWKRLKERVKQKPCRIVLPEGEDIRIMRAASILVAEKLAFPVLLGKPEVIQEKIKQEKISIQNISIVNPTLNPDRSRYINVLLELRKHKGLKKEEAEKMVDDILIHGCLMLKDGKVDGFVGGASRTTADTVRSGLIVIGVKKELKTVSGSFIIQVPNSPYGSNGWFVYADCAVVPHPSAQQLADIAVTSADTFRMFIADEPRIAFLSFSTKGSASDPTIDTIKEAIGLVKKSNPRLYVDGELQGDAALDPEVAKQKVKGQTSDVAGKANVLIFPDLNTGNIVYKLTQRLAHAEAIGPILQGLNGAINDLSRGCSVDDIIKNVLITSIQARG